MSEHPSIPAELQLSDYTRDFLSASRELSKRATLIEGEGRRRRLSQDAKSFVDDAFIGLIKNHQTVEQIDQTFAELSTYRPLGSKEYYKSVDFMLQSLRLKLAHYIHDRTNDTIKNELPKSALAFYQDKKYGMKVDHDDALEIGLQVATGREQLLQHCYEYEIRQKYTRYHHELVRQAETTGVTPVRVESAVEIFETAATHTMDAFKSSNAETAWWKKIFEPTDTPLIRYLKEIDQTDHPKSWFKEKSRQLKAVYGASLSSMTVDEVGVALTALEVTDKSSDYNPHPVRRRVARGLRTVATWGFSLTMGVAGLLNYGRSAEVNKVTYASAFSAPVNSQAVSEDQITAFLKSLQQQSGQVNPDAQIAAMGLGSVPLGEEQASSVPATAEQATSTPRPSTTSENATEQPTQTPETPTITPEPPTPTPDITRERVGDKDVLSYLFADLLNQVKQRRVERAISNPAVPKRVFNEFLNPEHPASNYINIAFLGIDATRERDFDPDGYGLSDIMMVLSFNPLDGSIKITSLPRDAYAPEIRDLKHRNGRSKYVEKLNSALYADRDRWLDGTPVDKLPPARYALLKAIMENASGVPIDGVAQVNIDFFQGFDEQNVDSIFDDIFNEKYPLQIEVPYNYIDREYPVGVGVTTVEFHKGQILTEPLDIVRYARSRKGLLQREDGTWVNASDTERQRKQQQVMQAVVVQLMRMTMDDLASGNTDTLARLIDGLNSHRDQSNFFHDDLDFVSVLQTIKSALDELSPEAKLALVANSAPMLARIVEDRASVFDSYSLRITDYPQVEVNDGRYTAFRLSPDSRKNEYGDYIYYYQPIRTAVAQRFGLQP